MAEEVTPDVIDVDMTPLTGAERWLSDVRERVADVAAQYHAYEIGDGDTLAQAKRERASVRRDIDEIDQQRKSLTRVIDDAVRRFRDDTKDVLKPLRDLDVAYKAEIDAYAERAAQRRRQALVETYEELAPLLAIPSEDGRALVPFDKVVERFGMGQKGKKWLLPSTNVEEAKRELAEALGDIQECESIITNSVNPDDVAVAKSVYFDTLDLAEALAEVERRSRQRRRLEALERERQEMADWEAEQRDRERTEREELPEPPDMPDEPEVAEEPQVPTAPPAEPPKAVAQWVFAGYGTREQADAFVAWCDANGVTRRTARPTDGHEYRLTARG